MKQALLLIIFLWLAAQAMGQESALANGPEVPAGINRQLDSILQLVPVFGKAAIIYRSGAKICTDTINLSRYKLSRNDSAIIFKGKDKFERRIAARDLWGMTTDYGERRRFYNGKALSIYRTKAPYVYKTENSLTVYYYFSETPASRIYPLSNDLIDQTIANIVIRQELYDFMSRHEIPGTGADRKLAYEFLYTTADVLITVSIELTAEILKGLLEALAK